jgi:hypothetical protein
VKVFAHFYAEDEPYFGGCSAHLVADLYPDLEEAKHVQFGILAELNLTNSTRGLGNFSIGVYKRSDSHRQLEEWRVRNGKWENKVRRILGLGVAVSSETKKK